MKQGKGVEMTVPWHRLTVWVMTAALITGTVTVTAAGHRPRGHRLARGRCETRLARSEAMKCDSFEETEM